MVYYLRCIYEDGSTCLGTWGNDIFKGVSLQRKLTNFKRIWNKRKDMHGRTIVGVEVEYCERTYSRPIQTERIMWE